MRLSARGRSSFRGGQMRALGVCTDIEGSTRAMRELGIKEATRVWRRHKRLPCSTQVRGAERVYRLMHTGGLSFCTVHGLGRSALALADVSRCSEWGSSAEQWRCKRKKRWWDYVLSAKARGDTAVIHELPGCCISTKRVLHGCHSCSALVPQSCYIGAACAPTKYLCGTM